MREFESNVTIESRPPKSMFWGGLVIVCFFVAMSCFAFHLYKSPNVKRTHPDTTPVVIKVVGIVAGTAEVSFLAGMGIVLLLSFFRCRVIADDRGLRWQGVSHRWRSVHWSEVTDYYDDQHLDLLRSRRVAGMTVVTTQGKITLTNRYSNIEPLRHQIQQNATAARVNAWEPLGVRRVDPWPQQFRYWDKTMPYRITALITISISAGILIAFSLLRLVTWYATVSTPAETTRISCALTFSYAMLWAVPVRSAWIYWTLWKRRGELFSASPETIRYENTLTNEVLEVPWSEVSDYFYRLRNGGFTDEGFALVLRGPDEKQVAWNRLLINPLRFLAIVQQYAPTPQAAKGEKLWRNKSIHEKTGGSDPTTWQGGAVGIGGRVFRNQSEAMKLLIYAISLICSLPVIALFQEWNKPQHGQTASIVQILAILWTPLLWTWVCYFRTRIETDDLGITHFTPFGKKHLYWYAVKDYTDWQINASKPGDPATVTGQNGTKILFWDSLNGYSDLKDEIERLAPPPKSGWKKA